MKRKKTRQHPDRGRSNSPRPRYKRTALGLLPDEWAVRCLGEFMQFRNGVNAKKEDYGKGIKFINTMEILAKSYITSEEIPGSVSLSAERIQHNLVKRGDILFNRTSETPEEIGLASVYLDDEEVVFGGFVIRGREVERTLADVFKKYCFSSSLVRSQIVSNGQGAIRSNISQSDLEKVQIPVPPRSEQIRIAKLLSAWDAAIDDMQFLIAQKSLHRKALMQQLLTGKKRLPGFRKRWHEIYLGDAFTERNENGGGDLPLLSITGDRGVIPQSQSDKRDNSTHDKSKYKRIAVGDIGYNTMRMWQGRSALSSIEGIVSPAYTIVVPKKSSNGKFFSYLFKTPTLIHLFFRNSQGLVEDTLNCRFGDFALVKVLVPEFDEQSAIALVLEQAEIEVQLLNRKLYALQEQKKGLIQKLLTGEIRVVKRKLRSK